MILHLPKAAVTAALLTLVVACDKPAKIAFEPSDAIVITTLDGTPIPAVIVKTKGGKIVSKGVVPNVTVAPEGIVSLEVGKIMPLKNGTATLTASAKGLPDATVDIKVSVVDNVQLTCSNPCAISVGGRVLIGAAASGFGVPSEGEVEWKSSKADVATVDKGTVTGVLPGTTTISATSGGKTATIDVVVQPPLDELRLFCPSPAFVVVASKTAAPIAPAAGLACDIPDGHGSVKLLLQGAKGTDVISPPTTWTSSSNSSLLVIDGEVSGRGVGKGNVQAIVGDLKAEMPVAVRSANKPAECTDPLGYGIEANVALALGGADAAAPPSKYDFMCASPSAAECVQAAAPAIQTSATTAPIALIGTVVAHAMSESARHCCCKPKQ